ncbi:MAG: glycosyltransferase family 2 protein [Prevotella sp.]|nr:glycosyltransferase family 2 protein [Prevotella sp.]
MEQIRTTQHPRIAILMATYNGEKYLAEQIGSILGQTNHDWHLYIHDDGSKDDTAAILNDHARKHPDEITVMEYPPQGGALSNFMSLLERVEADYYMFSDQDDVWMPEKVQLTLQKMREMEATYSANVPLVSFCDLQVVSSRLELKDASFFHARGIERMVFKERFFHLANMVPGCTMLFNRIARDTARPYQESKYIIHDYHIVLNALAHGGHIAGIPQPLISYRQHEDNVVGVGEKSETIANRLKSLGAVIKENKERYQAVKSITGLPLFTYLIIKIQSLFLISRK